MYINLLFFSATCGSSLGTIENSETLALVVGLVIMFILVIYSRLVLTILIFFLSKEHNMTFKNKNKNSNYHNSLFSSETSVMFG